MSKIPFAWPLNNRDGTFNKDVRRLNVMMEKNGEEVPFVKRPGTSAVIYSGTGNGQGLGSLNDILFGVGGDIFKVLSAPPNSGVSGAFSFSAANLPWGQRYGSQLLAFKGRLWMIGGVIISTITPQADIWSTQDGITWTPNSGAAPFGIRYGFQACVLNEKMYVMGGQAGAAFTFSNDVWSTTDGTNWVQETSAAPWLPRSFFSLTAANSGMYVIGGGGAFIAAHDDVWFSPNGRDWQRVGGALAWGTRQSHSTILFKGKMYLIGGINLAGVYQNTVYSSPDGINWTLESGAAFGAARAGVAAFSYGDNMFAFGGNLSGVLSSGQLYRSPASGTGAWTLVNTLPGPLGFSSAAVWDAPVSGSNVRYPTFWILNGRDAALNVGLGQSINGTLDTAIAITTAIGTPFGGQPYSMDSFNSATRLIVKNECSAWIYDAAALNRITDLNFPSITVPGLVVLGGFAFVMTPDALIYNCALDNPYYWPGINVIGADFEEDRGVAISKYQNYLVAFGEHTTQLFYDAGVPKGSPLKPYLNANTRIGCCNKYSVKRIGNNVAWMSQTSDRRFQIMTFEGLTPKAISTPEIEKILEANAFVGPLAQAYALEVPGHMLYCLSFDIGGVNGFTLAYDFTTEQWYEWKNVSDAGALYFSGVIPMSSAGSNANNLVQDYVGGAVRSIGTNIYGDNGVAFTVQIRTGRTGAGNNRMKAWGRTDVIGDRNASTPTLRFTDDDYQTYSPARTVDMNTERPALFRNGASRRRAWVYDQTDLQPMRVSHLEVEYDGELGNG